MSNIAIKAEDLSKRYIIGQRVKYKSLRDALTEAVKAPFVCVFSALRSHVGTEPPDHKDSILWALRDVSFEIRHGETVGIIGRNGAGKSTLLKLLSRITAPTSGIADIHGRVGSLLEVGTGFHPELTGRDNIFLNGAILGMKKREILQKFDEIVAFAEVERFLDTPVKHYSSGMYVRLAFAVAAHLEPEILLVDEVLAVGDAAFQRKCLGKMEDVAREGRTILFVSHNMGAVRGMCQRTVWIDEGDIAADGETPQVISKYLDAFSGGFTGSRSYDDEQVVIERVVFRNSLGEVTTGFSPGEDLVVEIFFRTKERIRRPHFWISVLSKHGSLFVASMLLDGHCPEHIENSGTITCRFKSLPLIPQLYTVRVGVRGEDGLSMLTGTKDVGFFEVSALMKDIGLEGELANIHAWDSTSMIVPYAWQLPDGRVKSVEIRKPVSRREITDELGR